MNQTIEIGGKSYPVKFGANAIGKVELFLAQHQMGTFAELTERLKSGGARPLDLLVIAWVAIDEGRRVNGSRPEPYTLEDVGDLVDEGGGVEMLAEVLEKAGIGAPRPNNPPPPPPQDMDPGLVLKPGREKKRHA